MAIPAKGSMPPACRCHPSCPIWCGCAIIAAAGSMAVLTGPRWMHICAAAPIRDCCIFSRKLRRFIHKSKHSDGATRPQCVGPAPSVATVLRAPSSMSPFSSFSAASRNRLIQSAASARPLSRSSADSTRSNFDWARTWVSL